MSLVPLTQDQIEAKRSFIKEYIAATNAADGSKLDANANVQEKNVATLYPELSKGDHIQINRDLVVEKIDEMFGPDLSAEYLRQIKDHEIYVHDETSGPGVPYCVSITMYPLVMHGMKVLTGSSTKPHHLSSFCGQAVSLLFAISSQFAGAVAAVEFLTYFDYFARKDYGDNYLETNWKDIESEFSFVVHTINQPAATRCYQSIFFNMSVFDKDYFEALFENFVFPDEECTRPNYETVRKLQVAFLEWFNEERRKEVLTFPVMTAAVLTDPKTLDVKDEEFVDMLSDQMSKGNSFFVYMSDNPDSLASCCFSEDQEVYARRIDFNDSSELTKVSFKEKFENPDKYDVNYAYMKGGWKECTLNKIPLDDRKMYKVMLDDNSTLFMTEDHLNPIIKEDVVVDIAASDLRVGDKMLAYQAIGQTYLVVKSINQESYHSEYVYCYEMADQREPYFTLPNGVITHNCRLRNEMESNVFSHTLGAGGVATGSVKVITLNMNRLIQDGRDLKTEVEKIHKYHVATRAVFEEFFKANMLTVYKAGFISMDKQFSTIGINGMVEAAEFLGLKPTNNQEYKEFLQTNLKVIFDANKEARKKYGCMFNTEFVPAENLGPKNAAWDKADGYVVNRDCYNSYFYVVEDEETSVIDKFVLHGKEVAQFLDGGSALHLNLGHYLNKEGYRNLFRLAAKTGCNYWCQNVLVTVCNKCNSIDKNTVDHCPKCGSDDVDYATRVIGYLKKISSFSKARREESARRMYH